MGFACPACVQSPGMRSGVTSIVCFALQIKFLMAESAGRISYELFATLQLRQSQILQAEKIFWISRNLLRLLSMTKGIGDSGKNPQRQKESCCHEHNFKTAAKTCIRSSGSCEAQAEDR
jgi:hypothetical protein